MEVTHSRTEHGPGRIQVHVNVVKQEQPHSLGNTVEQLTKMNDEKSAKLSEANIRLTQLESEVEYLTRKLKRYEDTEEAKEAKSEGYKKFKEQNRRRGNMSNRRAGPSWDIPSSNCGNQNAGGNNGNFSNQQNFKDDRNFQYRRAPANYGQQQNSFGHRRNGQSWDNSKPSSHGNQDAGEIYTDRRNFQSDRNIRHRKWEDTSETLNVQNNQHFPQQSGPGYGQGQQNASANRHQRTEFKSAPQETGRREFEAGNLWNWQSMDFEWCITVIKKLVRSQYFWTSLAIMKGAIYRFINQWALNYK